MCATNRLEPVEPVTLQQRVHGASRPASWHLDKLHRVLRVRRGIKNDGMKEDNLLSLSYGRIIPKDINTSEGLLPENFEGYQIVEPGNIVMRLTDLQNDKRSLRQGLVKERGIITSAYDALDVPKGQCPEFWFYSLLALDLAKHYYSLGGGVRQSVKFTDFPNDWIYRPDLTTQRQIAEFLDRETARIDLLIEKKQRMVELLLSKDKAMVKLHVLGQFGERPRSTNPVLWLPEMPSEWQLQRLARVFVNLDYRRIPLNSEERADLAKVYPYYGASGIIDQVDRYIFDGENILVGEDGANLIMQSTPIAFKATRKYWVNNHAHILSPKWGLIDFWVHLLNQVPFEIFVTGSAQPKLTSQALGNIVVPCPPPAEQESILATLEEARAGFLKLRQPIKSSITRLREYRSALITAAVTGQIDPATHARAGSTDRQLDVMEAEGAK